MLNNLSRLQRGVDIPLYINLLGFFVVVVLSLVPQCLIPQCTRSVTPAGAVEIHKHSW